MPEWCLKTLRMPSGSRGKRSEGRYRHECLCFRGVFGGIPGKILDMWRDGEIELLLTPGILAEYEDIVHRRHARYRVWIQNRSSAL